MTPHKPSLLQRLTPVSLEQSLGLAYLLFAMSMMWRPYLAGVEMLQEYYGVAITVKAVGALMAVVGGLLIGKVRVGAWAFGCALLLIPLYAGCLAFYMRERPTVGMAAFFLAVGCTLCLVSMYRDRAHRRAQEAKGGHLRPPA